MRGLLPFWTLITERGKREEVPQGEPHWKRAVQGQLRNSSAIFRSFAYHRVQSSLDGFISSTGSKSFMTLLAGRKVVITGGASPTGIGYATAQLFAQEGARVAILDLPKMNPEAVAKELGSEHLGLECDVRNKGACRDCVDRVAQAFDGINVLIGNAGVVYGTAILDISREEYDEVLDVNLRGNFHMAQAVTVHMRRRQSGSIVLMSSIAGQVGGGVFGRSHYAAAKSGIFGLAKAVARELAPDQIRVNAIAPGVIDNDFTKGRMTQEKKEEIAAMVPLGRLGTPEDVAMVCLFLASDLSRYMTGTVLPVNGGLLIS
jgi:NAD(P)-dependent dehydrogenase (short-subunit alcohol dehydrogenase family)